MRSSSSSSSSRLRASCQRRGAPRPACSALPPHDSSSRRLASRQRRSGPPRACSALPPNADSAAAADAPPDLYGLLGVPPHASPRQIKAAYLALMKQHHPDTQQLDDGSVGGEAAHALAVALNGVFQTLMHPETRALYDALAGFAAENAVNPFQDTSLPADQVWVDEVSCIGCGKCVRACPAAFFIEHSKYGRARVTPEVSGNAAAAEALAEEIDIAIQTCPVDTIHWVTAPQLALLETALSQMERVDAFLMLRGHRGGGSVFEAAHRTWQKRQTAIAALREQQGFAAAGAAPDGGSGGGGWVSSFFSQYVETRGNSNSGSNSGGGSSSGGSSGPHARGDPASRRVSELSRAATHALRRWQAFQSLARPPKALPDRSSGSSIDGDTSA